MAERKEVYEVAGWVGGVIDCRGYGLGVCRCEDKGNYRHLHHLSRLAIRFNDWYLVQGKSMESGSSGSSSEFAIGLSVLFVAQVLSAWMGVYVQDIYSKYHAHWLENLFYSHFLSLPLFLPLQGTLRRQYQHLQDSPPVNVNFSANSFIPSPLRPLIPQSFASTATSTVPQSTLLLLINGYTQLLCISGVYLLSARSSAVTVTVVLNVRKLVSFMFSVWLFGNELSGLMVVGAVLVFGAGALYGWETNVGMHRRKGKTAVSIKADRRGRHATVRKEE